MPGFKKDSLVEIETARFLDEHLYSMPGKTVKEYFCVHERFDANNATDFEQQMKGIDIIISSKDLHLSRANVDEKGQAHKRLNTFAFELRYTMYPKEDWKAIQQLRKDNDSRINWLETRHKFNYYENEGWLTSEHKKDTEFYMLIWYNKVNGNNCNGADYIKWYGDDDKIQDLDCALIKKHEILNFIKQNGYTEDELRKRAIEILESQHNGGRFERHSHNDAFWLVLTDHLPETPVNLVMHRETIFKLAKARWNISEQNDYIPVKLDIYGKPIL